MEERKKEVTLLDIFFRIFKHKILLGSVFLAVTLLSCWFLGVFSNQVKTSYNVSFYMSYPNTENLELPDGTSFIYTDTISEEALLSVYNSSQEYENVDIATLIKSISIVQSTEQITKNKTQTTYTINVPTKVFESKAVAKNFMKQLVNYQSLRILNEIEQLDYTNMFTDYESSNIAFDKKISFLSSQKQFLIDIYDQLSIQFPNAVIDVQEIAFLKQQINNYYNIHFLSNYNYEITTNGYAPESEVLAKEYQRDIAQYSRVYVENLEEIQMIKDVIQNDFPSGSQINDTTLQQQIVELEKENTNLVNNIILLNKKLLYATNDTTEINKIVISSGTTSKEIALEKSFQINVQERDAFETQIEQEFTQLKSFTQEYEECIYQLYDKMLKTSFTTPAVVSLVGGASKILLGSLSALIGFVVACLTSLIVDCVKTRKTEIKQADLKENIE